MQQPCDRTVKTLRLETERENLVYALDHAKLTKIEQTDVRRRLAIVEDELLHLFTGEIRKSN